ncbi:hypothetical protein V6N11_071908 [Hibiscus sabdariffa]|uniref:Uncharacterized protein n=1 Tax=Hibiscus sabdariffa TaxID=183260 RepID=A0ABR2U1I1_9ROSI
MTRNDTDLVMKMTGKKTPCDATVGSGISDTETFGSGTGDVEAFGSCIGDVEAIGLGTRSSEIFGSDIDTGEDSDDKKRNSESEM